MTGESMMDEPKEKIRGIVTRGVGGLYGVRTLEDPNTEILCRARGILRQKKTSPTVGDDVWIELSEGHEDASDIPEDASDAHREAQEFRDPEGSGRRAREGRRNAPSRSPKSGRGRSAIERGEADFDRGVDVDWVIDAVDERRSLMIRPPVANLDYLFAVIPCASPEPDLLTADKLTVIAENYGIECVIAVNKADLSPDRAEELRRIYGTAGLRVFLLSAATGEGVDALRAYLCEISRSRSDGRHVSGAFAGVSGAGKSTLMTALFPDLRLATGSVSRKIERGRHTTRHVELFPIRMGRDGESGVFWLADTPGFSMLDFTRFDFFPYDELASSFREFDDCLGKCRYTKCTHLREEGCAVLEKLRAGGIAPSRHDSYVRIWEEQRKVPEWKRKQNAE